MAAFKFEVIEECSLEMAKFTSEEVLQMRERYINEDAKSIYNDYKDRCSYQTLQ